MSQDNAFSYIRHGQTPFFRTRPVEFEANGAARYANATAVILGVPWDGGVTYRPGARFAPYEIRRVSALFQSFNPAHGVDVFRALSVVDGGNVVMPPFDAAAGRQLLEDEVARVRLAGAIPFLVGGDHSISLPALRALAKNRGPLAVLHVDAHLDTSTAEIWGEPHHHGTAFRHALLEGLIEPGQLFQVGIRASQGHPEEAEFSKNHGASIWSPDLLDEMGVGSLVERIRRTVSNRPLYLSIDIDGIDPAFAPGTGTPVSGGLTPREVLGLLRGLAGMDIVGMDLVEICPSLDHADITLHLGALLLYEGLSLVALTRRA